MSDHPRRCVVCRSLARLNVHAACARTIRLSPTATSAIDVDVFSCPDPENDPSSFVALREAVYNDGPETSLLVVPEDAEKARLVVEALNELSNDHDERARQMTPLGGYDDERRFASLASRVLTSTAEKIRAIMRT